MRRLTPVAILLALAFSSNQPPRAADGQPPAPVFPRAPLADAPLARLPLGSILPRGWLRRQLQIQASGLTGHLHDVWTDVGPNSGWLGGTGESWERGPYFLDGLVPLAYQLDDPALEATAQKFIDWTLTHQQDDGWLGPARNRDWWPNMVMLKALTQYQEATGDPRVIPALQRYFKHHLAEARSRPLHQWAVYRWADELVSVLWLYNRTGDASLLELARVLHDQGADWKRHFDTFAFTEKTSAAALGVREGAPATDAAMRAHGVNNAMALKTSAVWSLVSHDDGDRRAIYRALDVLDRYHGLPNGMFSATEHYAGRDPSQGVELCAVVEALFSLEQVEAVVGDPILADRLEKIAYNALPATFSDDMWAHQYDQQANQVLCSLQKRHWVSNGPEANLFGLEPNFGCCTANMHQGWPKLTESLWMATADGGVAATVYAPSEVRTIVAGGEPVRILEETDYPFGDTITLTVGVRKAVRFPLALRIPAWARGATVARNAQPTSEVPAGTFHVIDVTWQPGDRVVLRLPMQVRVTHGYRNSATIERGPLVFALRVAEDWTPVTGRLEHPAPLPAHDWEVHPASAWNYGLVLRGDVPDRASVSTREPGELPFSAKAAPVELRVTARRVPEWTLVDGSAGPLPGSPVRSTAPDETVVLVPYGAAKLRVAAFPWISGEDGKQQ